MENSKPYDEDVKLIDRYIDALKSYKDNELCCSLVYFLSQYSSSSKSIINKRKLFLLKVLREECINEFYFFDIKLFPREIGSKIITAYQEEIKKQDKEKQAHIAELMEEMNGLF